jgi:hypothetical protein
VSNYVNLHLKMNKRFFVLEFVTYLYKHCVLKIHGWGETLTLEGGFVARVTLRSYCPHYKAPGQETGCLPQANWGPAKSFSPCWNSNSFHPSLSQGSDCTDWASWLMCDAEHPYMIEFEEGPKHGIHRVIAICEFLLAGSCQLQYVSWPQYANSCILAMLVRL